MRIIWIGLCLLVASALIGFDGSTLPGKIHMIADMALTIAVIAALIAEIWRRARRLKKAGRVYEGGNRGDNGGDQSRKTRFAPAIFNKHDEGKDREKRGKNCF